MNGKAKNYELEESRIIQEPELKVLLKNVKPFMEQAVRDHRNLHHINDFFLIQLASLTGLRVSEIAGIKLKDINTNSIVVIGKGNRKRNIPLGKKSKALIDEFVTLKTEVMKQPTGKGDHLFLNQLRKPFDRFSINKRFKHWVAKSGINSALTFHSLRHRFATFLLNNGFNLAEVQRILGHSSVSVTSRYLHFTLATQAKVDAVL